MDGDERLGTAVTHGKNDTQHSDSAAPPDADDSDEALDTASAVRALYMAHGAGLLSYLMRLTKGDRHLAEDLLQETLLRAWRHPEARTNGEWSRPWLFMVARRIAIDNLRASLARPTAIGDERLNERARPDDSIERVSEQAEIIEVILELPVHYRGVLFEIYFNDRSVPQTAQILGIPEGTVKSRTFYALRELRKVFLDRGVLPEDQQQTSP